LFSATDNIKHKAILMIIYSAGLRISEASRLKINRHRQQAYDGEGRARQRRQRSLHHLGREHPESFETILEAVSSEGVVIRRSKRQHTYYDKHNISDILAKQRTVPG